MAQEQLSQAHAQRRPTVNLSSSLGFESNGTNRAFAFNSGELLIGSAQIETVMPVYTGGRIKAGIRRAEAGIGGANAQLEGVNQDLILQVVTAYVDVLRDRETVLIRQNSVDLLAEQVRAAVDRFSVGVVTRTDVAQSEARLEGAKAALASAQADVQGTQAVYAFLVGREAGELLPPPPVPGLPSTVEEAMMIALEQSPDISAAQFNERAAAEGVRAAYGALKPTVSIVGTASVQETYDQSFEATDPFAIARARDTRLSAVARATVPLYQGGLVRSQVRSAKLRREQARYQTDNAERQIRAQVAQAWYGSIAANRAIEASARQVEAADIAYQGAQEELAVGVRTTLDVLDQEQQLLEARLSLIQSERNAYVAAHQLLRAMGALETAQP